MAQKPELLIRHFNNPPSPSEFAALENANVPAVLKGCVKTWPAFHLWNPSNGGLTRLKQLAGTATVQVMASISGTNFYGNIRNHERIPIQFASFLNLIEEPRIGISHQGSELAFLKSQDVQVYLAQAGIFSRENVNASPLRDLLQDIETPVFLHTSVSAINLWMSVSGSRSSTHYDPFHNLLCVVSGCKQVKLWPPSCAPSLYPLAIHGEASNHSGVDFADPDLSRFPRFGGAMASCQSASLCAGDALFLPEGWFHQVDSEGVTVAVNLWWPSEVALKLGTHMDAYLLRRVVANLVDSEKEMIVAEFRSSVSGGVSDVRGGVTGVKERLSDVRKPVTDVVDTPCVAEPDKFVGESGRCVGAPVNGKSDGASGELVGASVNVQNVERSCKKSKRDRRRSKARGMKVALGSSEVDDSRAALGSDASPSEAVGGDIARNAKKPGTHIVEKPEAGPFAGAPVNVQNAEENRKKKPKRRSKVLAIKVAENSSGIDDLRAAFASPSEDVGGMTRTSAQKYSATSLTSAENQALRTLIVCVSDMMMSTTDDALEDSSQRLEDTSRKLEDTSQGRGYDTAEGLRQETIAAVLARLEAPSVQRILLVMSVEYPRTLEALVLHKLSPLGCEVLTRRFEEMDADAGLECPQEDFYAQIYSVFDDPALAMAALVDGKEALAALALQRVLDGNLGISCVPSI